MSLDASEFKLPRYFFVFALLFIILKVYFAWMFPVIGDEAYYFYWGTHPAGGYYDLSPMIGWWESFFTRVSYHPFWLRLPNLLTTGLVAFGIYEWLATVIQKRRALLIALLYWFAPVHFLGVLISPDVPLLLFSFFSCFLFYRTMNSLSEGAGSSSRFYLGLVFSGALWGAAFSSKYFAVFLIPAILIWFFYKTARWRFSQKWFALLMVSTGAFPFVFQHIWWNSQNCYANFIFNFVTRQKVDDGPLLQTFGFFLIYLVVLATPFLMSDSFRSIHIKLNEGFEKIAEAAALQRFLFLMWSVPILIFGLTALGRKGQGLHWYLSYAPFFFMWVGLKLSDQRLIKRLQSMMVMTGTLAIMVLLILQFPDKTIRFILNGRHDQDVKIVFNGSDFVEKVAPFINVADLIVADNYSLASEYSLLFGPGAPEVYVWGEGARFGRVFDWTAHFEKYRDRTLLLIARGELPADQWNRYFREVKSQWIEFKGARYWISIGFGFRDRLYHDEVLQKAYEKYYNGFLPEYLPQTCPLLKV